MSVADDFAAIEAFVLGAENGDYRSARAALERLRNAYKRYLDAAARVTDLANALYESEDSPVDVLRARELRRVLGDAYLGGPLL